MSKPDSKRQFQLVGSDPTSWLEQAAGLFKSAEALRDHFLAIRSVPPSKRRVETMGLIHSALLLLGLAVENAAKAVYVARDPKLISAEKLDPFPNSRDKGHGIGAFVAGLFTLTEAESALLSRLQEHVVWAGRYPIPRASTRYHDAHNPVNKRSMHPDDFRLAWSLIERMEEEVRSARQRQHLPNPPL